MKAIYFVNSVFIILSLTLVTQAQNKENDFLLLQVLHRHGDRTPVVLYKNDHYTKADFKEGLGQMTAVGKQRLFQFGKNLKSRYPLYFANVLPKNVRAQSSPSRRCLESSLLVLAGLFPPSQSWSNNSQLAQLWQPIAVETTEKPRAWLLNSEAYCPAATNFEGNITEIPSVKKFLSNHREFINKLEKYTGENLTSWYDVGYIWDTLFAEKEYFGNNFVKPKWLELVGNDTWERLYQFNEMEIGVFDLSLPYQRLRTGLFLKQILLNMNKTVSQTTITKENRQFYTYSSHDTFISYVLQAFGFFHQSPSYGSGLIFELRKDSNNVPNVHLFYSNATNNFDMYPLMLNTSKTFRKHCQFAICSLTNFTISLQAFLFDDIEKECAKK